MGEGQRARGKEREKGTVWVLEAKRKETVEVGVQEGGGSRGMSCG